MTAYVLLRGYEIEVRVRGESERDEKGVTRNDICPR